MIRLYLTDWDCFVIRRAMYLNAGYYMMYQNQRKRNMISAYNDVRKRKTPVEWNATVVRMIRSYVYRMRNHDKYHNDSFKMSSYDPHYYNPVLDKLTDGYRQYNEALLN